MVCAEDLVLDVELASEGKFGPEPQSVYSDWTGFLDWARAAEADGTNLSQAYVAAHPDRWGPPVPEPRQVFAVGLNYASHAAEVGLGVPGFPSVFTKFPSSLAGPFGPLTLSGDTVDWEVELVVAIGRHAENVAADEALEYVAGVMIGQDYSDRRLQMAGDAPQFSLAKSFAGYAPTGPCLVMLDEVDQVEDLELTCLVNGELVQSGRTSLMHFTVRDLIRSLSSVCRLLPGDLIFTGTPDGVGMSRTPPRYLKPGNVVVSRIGQLGELRQTCVAGRTSG